MVRLKSLNLSPKRNVGFATHRPHAAGHKRVPVNARSEATQFRRGIDPAWSTLLHQKLLDGCLVELPADKDDSRAAIVRRPFGERLGGPE